MVRAEFARTFSTVRRPRPVPLNRECRQLGVRLSLVVEDQAHVSTGLLPVAAPGPRRWTTAGPGVSGERVDLSAYLPLEP